MNKVFIWVFGTAILIQGALIDDGLNERFDNIEGNLPYTVAEYWVTAYCAGECCCENFADGITASGHRIRAGDKLLAAGQVLPFTTIIDVPGYGIAPVLDRGGDICDDCLDVYFDSHEQAVAWGVQHLKVKVYK